MQALACWCGFGTQQGTDGVQGCHDQLGRAKPCVPAEDGGPVLLAGTGWLIGTSQAVVLGGQGTSQPRATAAVSRGTDPDRV